MTLEEYDDRYNPDPTPLYNVVKGTLWGIVLCGLIWLLTGCSAKENGSIPQMLPQAADYLHEEAEAACVFRVDASSVSDDMVTEHFDFTAFGLLKVGFHANTSFLHLQANVSHWQERCTATDATKTPLCGQGGKSSRMRRRLGGGVALQDEVLHQL